MVRFIRNLRLRIAGYRYAFWINFSKEGKQLRNRQKELDEYCLKILFGEDDK